METDGDLKKQRAIFEKMEVGIPVEANIVIRKGGV
jgi:hypothetical protein